MHCGNVVLAAEGIWAEGGTSLCGPTFRLDPEANRALLGGLLVILGLISWRQVLDRRGLAQTTAGTRAALIPWAVLLYVLCPTKADSFLTGVGLILVQR